jgi:diacylglycerol kinase family enzyme
VRAVLIVNPNATSTTPAGRDLLAHALESRVKLTVVHTDHRGHAVEIASDAVRDGVDVLIVHGGDGTVNEVVNGILGEGGPNGPAPAVGVVPGGSANVFARSLGLPRDPVDATHQLLHALVDGRRRRVNLGRVDSDGAEPARWFTFSAGVGWDADVVAEVDRKRGKKASPALYTRVATTQYLKPAHGGPRLTVEIPGEEPVSDLRLVFVSNTDPWTYLGARAIHLNRGTSFDTDLGIFALHTLRLPTVLRHLGQAISRKGEQKGAKLFRRDDVPMLTITSPEPVRVQCDGDLIGDRTCVKVASVRHALCVAG